MTKIKTLNLDIVKIGEIIKKARLELTLPNQSRQFFLDDRVRKGLLDSCNLSEKTLSNIENGLNLPNLVTLKYLSTALEIDFIELVKRIKPYIPDRSH